MTQLAQPYLPFGIIAGLSLTSCLLNPFDPLIYFDLVETGADKPVRASQVFTSPQGKEMALAIARRNRAKVKQLAASPDLVNLRGPHEITPLWLAVRLRDRETVQILLEAGADPSVQTDYVEPVLIKALKEDKFHRDPGLFDLLMDHGANPNVEYRNSGQVTPAIHFAHYSREKLKRLVNAGADIDATSSFGTTAVALQAAAVTPEHALHYLELGADWRKPSTGGRNLLEAMEYQISFRPYLREKYKPIYQWLRDHGQIDAQNRPLPASALPEPEKDTPQPNE